MMKISNVSIYGPSSENETSSKQRTEKNLKNELVSLSDEGP